MEPALSAVEGSAARCLRSGRVCGARDLLFPLLECGGGLRAIGARRETRRRFPASTMSSREQRVVCAPDVFAERGICCFPLGVRRLDAAFPPLRCHPERSEGSAFGVMEPAPTLFTQSAFCEGSGRLCV